MGLLDDDQPEILLHSETISRDRSSIPLLLAVAGLLVLGFTQWPLGSDPAVNPVPTTTTTTIPTSSTSERPATEPDVEARMSLPEISLLSSSVAGDLVVVVPFSSAGEVRPLGAVSDIQLDSSGTYMAALLGNVDATTQRPLVVGRVDGTFDRLVTESAAGFAWHDSEPGTLAFLETADETTGILHTLDVASINNASQGVLPVEGWLQHFGAWGFSTTRLSFSPGFQMFDPSGTAVFESVIGTVVGYVPTIGVIATLSVGDHVAIDPASGETTPLGVFAGNDVLWRVSTGGPRGTFAVHATTKDFAETNVLVINRLNEVVARFPSAPLHQAMRWNTAGTKLIFTVDDSTDRLTLIVYEAETGTTIESSFIQDPLYPRTLGVIVD